MTRVNLRPANVQAVDPANPGAGTTLVPKPLNPSDPNVTPLDMDMATQRHAGRQILSGLNTVDQPMDGHARLRDERAGGFFSFARSS